MSWHTPVSLHVIEACKFHLLLIIAEVAVDKTKAFCPMARCEGICDGLPGVAQPSVCKEVNLKKTAVIYTT